VKTDAERGTAATEAPAEAEAQQHRGVLRFLGELPGLIVLALVLALLIKTFLLQAFFIPSQSMEPTLTAGDRVLVTKIPYWFGEPSRGDVIVFEDPTPGQQPQRSLLSGVAHWLFQGLGVEQPDNEDFIKRVVGLPGDVVTGRDGKVFVNGTAIDEVYLTEKTREFRRFKVPEDSLFVMGDNRSDSFDSRFGLGFVPLDSVIGKAFLIVWPPPRMNTL
jgi:signal peptidase I